MQQLAACSARKMRQDQLVVEVAALLPVERAARASREAHVRCAPSLEKRNSGRFRDRSEARPRENKNVYGKRLQIRRFESSSPLFAAHLQAFPSEAKCTPSAYSRSGPQNHFCGICELSGINLSCFHVRLYNRRFRSGIEHVLSEYQFAELYTEIGTGTASGGMQMLRDAHLAV
jgi:hypothetical protein